MGEFVPKTPMRVRVFRQIIANVVFVGLIFATFGLRGGADGSGTLMEKTLHVFGFLFYGMLPIVLAIAVILAPIVVAVLVMGNLRQLPNDDDEDVDMFERR
jgi:uncharacterized membrane protein